MNTNWIAWLNFFVLLVSALLFLYFYNLSVSPVQLAQRIGPQAWVRCGRCRVVAILFELLAAGCYVIYFLYPLPLPLPTRFAWGWGVSLLIALLIAVPSMWLMVRGMVDAGPEAIAPQEEQAMFGGIYARLRHPQAVGEVFIWWVLAFGLNSPHLVLISLIWLPIFYGICVAEEKDLVLRFGSEYREYQQNTGRFWPRRAA